MINQEQKAIDSESAIRHDKMSYHLFPSNIPQCFPEVSSSVCSSAAHLQSVMRYDIHSKCILNISDNIIACVAKNVANKSTRTLFTHEIHCPNTLCGSF